MIEERWVDEETRDAELEALLASAIEAPTDDGVMETLRYGATIDLEAFDEDEDDDGEQGSPLALFTVAPPRRDGRLRVLGALPGSVYELEYERETLKPGRDWPARHQALFWRAVAESLRHRYSDALLNRTADALAQAIPWYEEHRPTEAASMLGWRARVLGYASYGADDILPEVDRAIDLLERHRPDPSLAYVIVLQLCEAIRRVRGIDHRPHTRQLFDLGMRGLDLADQLGEPPQRAELLGSVAEALVNRPPDVDLDAGPLARRLGAAGDPLAVAEAAWARALELEDGMFYGTFRDDHVTSHKEAYTQGLMTIALRRGDLSRALASFAALPAPHTVYERLNRTKTLARLLARDPAARDAQASALADRLRADLLEGPALTDWDLEQAGHYLRFVRYRLWNLGHRASNDALIDAICARHGLARTEPALAVEEEEESDEVPEADDDPAGEVEDDDVDASPEERSLRRANDAVLGWLRDTRLALLVGARVGSRGTDRLRLQLTINVPEHALDALLADPAIAAHLSLLDRRLAEALPGIEVEREVRALALDTGIPPDTSLRTALSFARATAALERFGLEPDARWLEMRVGARAVARLLSEQRVRRIHLDFGRAG